AIRLCQPCDRDLKCDWLTIRRHCIRHESFGSVRKETPDLDTPFDLEAVQQARQRFEPGGSGHSLGSNVSEHLVAKLDGPDCHWSQYSVSTLNLHDSFRPCISPLRLSVAVETVQDIQRRGPVWGQTV